MESNDTREVTREIANAARAIRFANLPEDVVFLARQCVLDWLGVTLAGAGEPLSRMVREQAASEGGHPQATLIGSGGRVSLQQAALVNGAASHALDFDDVHTGMSGHPSVPVLPALLALAEYRGASAEAFIAAFVAGFEVECRVGAYVMPGHYATGFHATGTLGTFGAAAACAHLLGLDEARWLHAFGIAGAQAAGLKSMFGTMCKPLHAGKASANGLLAALLAQRGFTSNTAVLETPQGFAATQTTTPNAARALSGLGAGYEIRGALFKYHAACYGTHETIEGVLRIKERASLQPADVREIRLTVPPGNLTMCNIQQPSTALEGKFSMRFTAALALATGETGEQAFTDAAVRRPDLISLRDRVRIEAGGGAGTTVRIELADGRALEESVNLQVPATDLQQQWQRLEAKFRSLAAPVVGAGRASELADAVRRLETLPDMAAVPRLATAPAPAALPA
ncbi:MAG: MmgE/PrpD family protein [Chloroflexi bacterium]|nr:MmgE/PrpD family protein [Chloroflexota bacterium]